MRKLACLIIFCSMLTGCATLEKQGNQYKACVDDPACLEKMHAVSVATSGVAGIAAAGFESPMSIPIAGILTLLISLITGVYLGGKKMKLQSPVVINPPPVVAPPAAAAAPLAPKAGLVPVMAEAPLVVTVQPPKGL